MMTTMFKDDFFDEPFLYRSFQPSWGVDRCSPFMKTSLFSPNWLALEDACEKRRQRRETEARMKALAEHAAYHQARKRQIKRMRQQRALQQAFVPTALSESHSQTFPQSHSTSVLYRSDGSNKWESRIEKKNDTHGNFKTYVTDTFTDKDGQKRIRKRQKHVLKGASDAEVLDRFEGASKDGWDEVWEKGGLGDRMEGGSNLLTASETKETETKEAEMKEAEMKETETKGGNSTMTAMTKKEEAKGKREGKRKPKKNKVLLEDASDDESDVSSVSTASTSTSSLSSGAKSSLPSDWMVPVEE
ncbi:hypothetical protein TrCOL_g10821 [Triparma columacea]|uniref:Uncharacterized protein n=1 Tax=Triparma columacea TaxID=722753 RepID=A0A9W7GN61_9STRA|nr:hypothetical protein TrCOL_g10821 [Triparma columacea]